MTNSDVQIRFQDIYCFVSYVKQLEIFGMSSELKEDLSRRNNSSE